MHDFLILKSFDTISRLERNISHI